MEEGILAMTDQEKKTSKIRFWVALISSVLGLIIVAAVARGHIVETLSVPDRLRDLQLTVKKMEEAVITSQRIRELENQMQQLAPMHTVVEMQARLQRVSQQQDIMQAQIADQRVTLSRIESDARHIRELLDRLEKNRTGI
jgi:hypothetical protein